MQQPVIIVGAGGRIGHALAQLGPGNDVRDTQFAKKAHLYVTLKFSAMIHRFSYPSLSPERLAALPLPVSPEYSTGERALGITDI